jgi:hypothetical protein
MKSSALPQDRLAGDEPGNNAAYEEYLRGFDEIPVLVDAVRIPPRRQLPPNFVRGERRDVRHEARPDGYSLREANLAETELLYLEYSRPAPARAARVKPKTKRATKPTSKRKTKKRSRA